MALESANYIDELVITNPTSGDPVSQGDDQLRLIKKVVKQSFPSVDIAVNAIHTSASAPATSISAGLVWFDTTANLLKIRDEANSAWITLPVSVTADNTVDINGGSIDGTVIGGTTAAAGTFAALEGTVVTATTSVNLDTGASVIFEGATADAHETTLNVVDPTADRTLSLPNATDTLVGKATTDTLTNKTLTSPVVNTGISGTAVLDSDTMSGASATTVSSSESIKAYVDAQVSAHDLDYTDASDTAGLSVDLDTQTFKITGSSGITTSGTGQILTVTGENATTSAKGVASFSSDHFDVTSGAVTIKADGIDDTLIDFGTGTNQVSTADVPEQTNLYYTDGRADGRIAAADIGDLSNVDTTGVADDDILKYDAASSSFKVEPDRIANHLTTKGDLLGFSTTETRVPVGADGKVLTARASATYGIDWEDLVDNSAAMALALGG